MNHLLAIALLSLGISSQGIACYVNKPMHQEITRIYSNATDIRHAPGEFTAQAMDFYVTFKSADKHLVGLIKFHQLNCSVLKSEFHESEEWQPGP